VEARRRRRPTARPRLWHPWASRRPHPTQLNPRHAGAAGLRRRLIPEDHDSARWIAVRPGDVLDKRWEVTNSGTCNWDERYRLKLMDGPEMGNDPVGLYPARRGWKVIIGCIHRASSQGITSVRGRR
jgi:hypothetical protein